MLRRLLAPVAALVVLAALLLSCTDDDGDTAGTDTGEGSSGVPSPATEPEQDAPDEALAMWTDEADMVCTDAAAEVADTAALDVDATAEESLDLLRAGAEIQRGLADDVEAVAVPEGAGEQTDANIEAYLALLEQTAALYEEATAVATLDEFIERSPALDDAFLRADVAALELGATACVAGNLEQLREVVQISDDAAAVIEGALLAWEQVLDVWGLTAEEIDCVTAELARRYVTEELDPEGDIDPDELAELLEDCVDEGRIAEVQEVLDALELELATWEQGLLADGFTQEETDCLVDEIAARINAGELEPGEQPDADLTSELLEACLSAERIDEILEDEVSVLRQADYQQLAEHLTDVGFTLDEINCIWSGIVGLYLDGTLSLEQRPDTEAVVSAVAACTTPERIAELAGE